MNSAVLVNIARFILLLAAQIIIFNNIDFLGYVNPFPYILFIILFPVNGNKSALMISSFFLGIVLDLFSNSGGVHAASCLLLAYFRPYIFKFSFGLSYEYQTVRLNDVLTTERFSFILIAVAIHHLTLFLLEVFQLNFLWDILLRTLLSTAFTIIVCIVLIYIFKPNRR
ncbi:rod shape-determining protein MreD [Flavobacterium sp. GT3R68]|uniref:rod shape-determining protein MreD n=1 Tax=Flavobacterium sp. GT3R68 TaxID=2594437 RepID=UPI000F8657A6|nr:rod shape-determining protein MreD [Flavobacterium sp. GT3R68]RTY92451.1 rod shape-determining protein MreD [Flavobacterium sp. GSN2]TRW94076.1 rod shape-determining protein MreD [Flavobacterium sp. GT3R68]